LLAIKFLGRIFVVPELHEELSSPEVIKTAGTVTNVMYHSVSRAAFVSEINENKMLCVIRSEIGTF